MQQPVGRPVSVASVASVVSTASVESAASAVSAVSTGVASGAPGSLPNPSGSGVVSAAESSAASAVAASSPTSPVPSFEVSQPASASASVSTVRVQRRRSVVMMPSGETFVRRSGLLQESCQARRGELAAASGAGPNGRVAGPARSRGGVPWEVFHHPATPRATRAAASIPSAMASSTFR